MSRGTRIAAVVLLLAMFSLELFSAVQESQTIDEAVHLSAGYSYWKTGDFRLNPEHPPLLKLLAAFPLLFSGATIPLNDPTWERVEQWSFAEKFLYENRLSPDTLLFLGRLPIILLSLVLGWFIFSESRKMFGNVGGFLSLGLYVFDPNIIAHSRYVTTDLGFSAFAFFSLIRLRILFEKPNRRNTKWFFIVLLITCLTKFSFFAFFIALAVGLVVMKFKERRYPALDGKRIVRSVLIALPISLVLIWAVYGFDVRRPTDDPRIAQLYEQRENALANNLLEGRGWLERFVVNDLGDRTDGVGKLAYELAQQPYPMYTFFRGAINVLGHSVAGQTSFLLGEVRDQGWWYYFPVAVAAKTPPATLLAFAGVLIFALLRVVRRKSLDRRWILFGIVPAAYFGLSLFSHLNLGWRYIMPVYPPLFVLAGALATVRLPVRHAGWLVACVVLFAGVGTQLKTFPNELGYFNFFAGGSRNGHEILRDSNLDWGQGLVKLKSYIAENRLTNVAVVYYGSARVSAYVPDAVNIEHADFVAISSEHLYAVDGSYAWLQAGEPMAVLDPSMSVYTLKE